VTVGDTVANLRRRLGEPIKTDEHFTCPKTLGTDRTVTYYYSGMSFWGCEANGLVYLIDIP